MRPNTLAAALLGVATQCLAQQPYSTWMADSFIERGIEADRYYDTAVFYRALEFVYNKTGNASYYDTIQASVDSIILPNNTLNQWNYSEHDLDDVRVGTTLLYLYNTDGDEKYKATADFLKDWLDIQKRNPLGGFWHKDPKYPNQMWLDGLFMAEPFYAQYLTLFQPDNATAWNDILLQFDLIEEHCKWNDTNLLVHGWDQSRSAVFADPVTGQAPHVWDRAMGWYLVALVDVLDYYPMELPGYNKLMTYFKNLSATVLDVQDESGGWWLVIDPPYPGMEGNYIESSGTAMFTYSWLKGIRKGYLEKETYLAPAEKAYELMVDRFVAHNGTNGTLNWEGTVIVGSLSGNGSYEYYIEQEIDENDLKGAGPFIYASVEYEAMIADAADTYSRA